MEETHQLYPLMDPALRKNKRLMTQEAKSSGRKLGEAEQLMGEAVFTSVMNGWMSYQDAYTMYLEVYQKVLSQIKVKYIYLNPKYFMEMYKNIPQKIKLVNWVHDFHELLRYWGGLIPKSSQED